MKKITWFLMLCGYCQYAQTGADNLGSGPANDDLINAIPLVVNMSCSGDAYTNIGATTQPGEPSGSCHYNDDPAQTTVWFSFVAPNNGEATISTDIPPGDLNDSQIIVFAEPSNLNDLTTLTNEIGCDEDSGEIIGLASMIELTGLVPGNTYYVQIDGYSGDEGDFCIEITNDACPAPDDFLVTSIGDDSASFTWFPMGTESNWEVEYGPAGFTFGTGIVVEVSPNPEVELLGLAPETHYEVYLTAICGVDISGPVGPIDFTTYGANQCGQSQNSNGFENAFFMQEGGQLVANDFNVLAGTANFSLEKIIANLWTTGGVLSVDVLFFQNNNGVPGEQIGAVEGLAPTSQTVVGNMGGFDVEEMVLDFPNPVDFAGSPTENTTYWIQLIATPVVPGTQVAWEVSRAGVIGYETAYDDNVGEWSLSAGNDGVFDILGTCSLMGVENLKWEGFSFYPNPVNDELFLKADRKIEKIVIYDILGREKLKMRPNSLQQIVKVNGFSAGIFLMTVEINGSTQTHRIIVN